MQVQHVASFKHVRIDVRLHHVLELLAATQVLRGRWHVRILVHAELEALLDRLEGRHLRGWDLRVGALGGDGLVAVLHHEVSLRALHEVLLELGGRRVSVGVGVLLEAVLAELGALTVEVEAAVVLVDRQGLRRRSLFDDALLVASSCLAKSWPRHDVLVVSCLNLHIAPAGNQVHALIRLRRPERGCQYPLCGLSFFSLPLPICCRRSPLPLAASLVQSSGILFPLLAHGASHVPHAEAGQLRKGWRCWSSDVAVVQANVLVDLVEEVRIGIWNEL